MVIATSFHHSVHCSRRRGGDTLASRAHSLRDWAVSSIAAASLESLGSLGRLRDGRLCPGSTESLSLWQAVGHGSQAVVLVAKVLWWTCSAGHLGDKGTTLDGVDEDVS